jgi:hypothetical protein
VRVISFIKRLGFELFICAESSGDPSLRTTHGDFKWDEIDDDSCYLEGSGAVNGEQQAPWCDGSS